MKKVLVVCPFPENLVPGQRLKYEQYFRFFREAGYFIEVRPFISPELYAVLYQPGRYWLKFIGVLRGYLNRILLIPRLRDYAGLYVFLYVTPFGSPLFELLYRIMSKRMIYDIDDLVFLGRSSHANSFARLIRGRSKYHYLMRAADHVVTCTPYLDSYVRRFNNHTTDISSTIRTDDYLPANPYSNARTPVLGWSGSHSTASYLSLLGPALRSLSRRRSFKLLVIGAPDFRMEGIDVEAIAWNEASEVADLQRIDIGLYPLPFDEWVLGKSGLKALQYMALGIPTVATNVGTISRIIKDRLSGFLVISDTEWEETLLKLIDDPELRRTVGSAARADVEAHFSVAANRHTYLRIFEDVFGAP